MIRPILYVDLPGIIYALDHRARARNLELARFVVAPHTEDPRSSLAALLSALWPITPNAHTWIAEDRWRLLGVAQTRPRPGGEAWDLTYLGAMVTQHDSPDGGTTSDDVLLELAQYALNAALMRGVHRFFAQVNDDEPVAELFGKLGFQIYARELTYWSESPSCALRSLGESGRPASSDEISNNPAIPLRRWHPHDAWGLLRLYDACTPQRVRLAESLASNEFLHTRAGGGRTWYLPLLEPAHISCVCDRGIRLGGWMRLRYGRGAQPHQLWLMAHPDEPDTGMELLRAALRLLAREGPRPVVCQVREYEGTVIDALRTAGFERASTHALMVRHLALRALRKREAHALEPRVVYGVKGLGPASSHLSEGESTRYATRDH